jgi:hypothetical protein
MENHARGEESVAACVKANKDNMTTKILILPLSSFGMIYYGTIVTTNQCMADFKHVDMCTWYIKYRVWSREAECILVVL